MKTGILITARLGSTRLKRKHLLIVNGRPIIYYLIERIKREFGEEIKSNDIVLVIATSDERENREFEEFANSGLHVFYGSLTNIPLRQLQAAKSYLLDNVISIDGDDILCSVKGIRYVYDALIKGLPYIKTSGLPFGMNSSGYSKGFLELALINHTDDILETGWGRIFNKTELVDINIPLANHDIILRFTLDYEEDFDFFKSVIQFFGEDIYSATDEDIINVVLDKELFKINESIAKEYWNNYYKSLEKEE